MSSRDAPFADDLSASQIKGSLMEIDRRAHVTGQQPQMIAALPGSSATICVGNGRVGNGRAGNGRAGSGRAGSGRMQAQVFFTGRPRLPVRVKSNFTAVVDDIRCQSFGTGVDGDPLVCQRHHPR